MIFKLKSIHITRYNYLNMIILRCFVFALLIFSISSTNITNLTNCSAGYYISTNATATNDRVCSGCLANTFSSFHSMGHVNICISSL